MRDFSSYIEIGPKTTKASIEAGLSFVADLSGVVIYNSPNNRPLYYVTRKNKTIGHIMYRSKKKTLAFKAVNARVWFKEPNPVKGVRTMIRMYREEKEKEEQA